MKITDSMRNLAGIPLRAIRHFQWRLMKSFYEYVTINTKQGLYTIDTLDGGLGQQLFIHRQYEYDSSLKFVGFLIEKQFINSGHISMIDLGANIGVISIGLAKAGLIEHAIAIEPESRNFRLLERNVTQNGLSNKITCLNIAAGKCQQTLSLQLSKKNYGDHRIKGHKPLPDNKDYMESTWDEVQVAMFPLDDVIRLLIDNSQPILSWPPALLWIDVQGHEGYVFQGAAELLKNGLPTIAEIWPYGILRSGMEITEFIDIVEAYWTHYWVIRRERFVKYPISAFASLIDELWLHSYENVVFTRCTDVHE